MCVSCSGHSCASWTWRSPAFPYVWTLFLLHFLCSVLMELLIFLSCFSVIFHLFISLFFILCNFLTFIFWLSASDEPVHWVLNVIDCIFFNFFLVGGLLRKGEALLLANPQGPGLYWENPQAKLIKLMAPLAAYSSGLHLLLSPPNTKLKLSNYYVLSL